MPKIERSNTRLRKKTVNHYTMRYGSMQIFLYSGIAKGRIEMLSNYCRVTGPENGRKREDETGYRALLSFFTNGRNFCFPPFAASLSRAPVLKPLPPQKKKTLFSYVLHPPTLLFLFYGYEEINNLK